MLNWLTTRHFNPVDLTWYGWFLLAWHDQHYFAAVVAIVGGCVVSSALEAWHKHRTPAAQDRGRPG